MTTTEKKLMKFPVERVVMRDNVRTHMDREELDSLKASILDTHGAKQPVVGYLIDGEPGEGAADVALIMGDRRLAATKELAAEGHEEHAEIAVLIEAEPTRREFLKWNLIENLQRESLRYSDVGRRYAEMLEEADEVTGQPAWTMRTLAEETGRGKNFVQFTMNLLRAPERVQAAVDDGISALEVGSMLATLPKSIQMPAAEDCIFGPNGPVSLSEARRIIAEKYRRDLRKADFSTEEQVSNEEGEFLRVCQGCKWWGGNRDDVPGKSATLVCLNPSCFSAKQRAKAMTMTADRRELVVDEVDHGGKVAVTDAPATTEGRVSVLSEEAGADLIHPVTGGLDPASGLVDMDAKPDAYFLEHGEQAQTAVPVWRVILDGSSPEVTVVFDGAGKRIEAVDAKVALLAAARSKWAQYFRRDRIEKWQTPEEKALSAKREAASRRAELEVRRDAMTEFLKCVTAEDSVEIRRQALMAVMEVGQQREDMEFFGAVLGEAFFGSPVAGTEIDLAEAAAKLDPDQLAAATLLAVYARKVRLTGWQEWEEEEGPMAAICEAAEFSPREWSAKVRRVRKKAAEGDA